MNEQPPKRPIVAGHSRLCLMLSDQGLTVYGNREALSSLAEQIKWASAAAPEDCFECHVRLTFEEPDSLLGLKPSEKAWVRMETPTVIFSEATQNVAPSPDGDKAFGFELTIMHVTDAALNALAIDSKN